jgi:hypothetical protein
MEDMTVTGVRDITITGVRGITIIWKENDERR